MDVLAIPTSSLSPYGNAGVTYSGCLTHAATLAWTGIVFRWRWCDFDSQHRLQEGVVVDMYPLGVQWETMLGMHLGNSGPVINMIERPWVAAPLQRKSPTVAWKVFSRVFETLFMTVENGLSRRSAHLTSTNADDRVSMFVPCQ